jgi:pimeloyl-ACP methyl ester carboxylesterase
VLKSSFGAGNDCDINFVPDYKVLHDAGYNVLAFDFRNFGLSAAANGGTQSASRFEARDVLGALDYVRRTADLAAMKIGVFARCLGANATFRAMHDKPAAFTQVRALVAPLLLSPRVILKHQLTDAGLGEYVDKVDRRQRLLTSVTLEESSPILWAPSVTLPTLTYGVWETISWSRETLSPCTRRSRPTTRRCSGSRTRVPAGTATPGSSATPGASCSSSMPG